MKKIEINYLGENNSYEILKSSNYVTLATSFIGTGTRVYNIPFYTNNSQLYMLMFCATQIQVGIGEDGKNAYRYLISFNSISTNTTSNKVPSISSSTFSYIQPKKTRKPTFTFIFQNGGGGIGFYHIPQIGNDSTNAGPINTAEEICNSNGLTTDCLGYFIY